MIWLAGALVVGVVAVFFAFLKRRQDEVEASFQRRFAGKKILFMDKHALYFARQSDDYSHFRGTGYLVLTEDELYFERQLAGKTFIIPTSSIREVETTRRLGGQSAGKRMLKVVFEAQDGQQDAIAWKVRELERWLKEVSSVVGSPA